MNLPILTSDFFTKKDPDRAIKDRIKFAEAAFDLLPMEISGILDHDDGYYILQVIDNKPEKIPEFKDVSDRVRQDLIKEKQDETAKKAAEETLDMLKKGNSLDDEAQKLDMIPQSTGFFKRNESIPKIGYEPSLSEAAFSLSEQKTIPDDIIKGKKGYYVIHFKERKVPEEKSFSQQEPQIRERLIQQKKSTLFDELLAKIKKDSDIEIEERFLE
jgi:parvulin-like peptidyl-prolyl isomerase